jgi:hypothetical protein
MTSSDDHESLIPSELDRPPSPFLTSAVLSGAGKASSTLKQDIDAGQVPEDEGSRQTTDPSRRTRTPTRTPASHVPLKFRVVCPYWYHFGLCEKSDDLCKYSHIVSESTERMAFMPIRSRSHACGLPLCKFRDGSVPKSTPSRVEPTAFNHVDAPQALSSSVPPQPIQQAVRPSTITHTKDVRNQGTKRQLPHWDAPTSAQKRAKFMDYDDQADSSSRGSADCRVTCFFWYHGSCGRSEDERTGFRCQYKHGLTEPPSSKIASFPIAKMKVVCMLI